MCFSPDKSAHAVPSHAGGVNPAGPQDIIITLLSNSVYYFLETVYIAKIAGQYRLIVLHDGELLTREEYDSVKGAKIAFLKLYSYKAWKAGVKPNWTHFYGPDFPGWLAKNRAYLEEAHGSLP